jgi:hypothetical protein
LTRLAEDRKSSTDFQCPTLSWNIEMTRSKRMWSTGARRDWLWTEMAALLDFQCSSLGWDNESPQLRNVLSREVSSRGASGTEDVGTRSA